MKVCLVLEFLKHQKLNALQSGPERSPYLIWSLVHSEMLIVSRS